MMKSLQAEVLEPDIFYLKPENETPFLKRVLRFLVGCVLCFGHTVCAVLLGLVSSFHQLHEFFLFSILC